MKAIGLSKHVIGQLNNRLSRDFPDRFVAIKCSADVSVDLVSTLVGSNYAALAAELASTGHADQGVPKIALRPQRRVQ